MSKAVAAALPLVGISAPGWLALIALVCAVGCKTPMGSRKDGGPGVEAGISPDTLATPDLVRQDASPDLLTPDGANVLGVPKAFRFDNRTLRTAYVQVASPVGCRMAGASGWQTCQYFTDGCSFLCHSVQENQNCCVSCEQNLDLFAIPAGQSRSLPWDGTLFTIVDGRCSACGCQEQTPVSSGAFEASARVFADYQCLPAGCQILNNGTIQMATPEGAYASLTLAFNIPFADEEVVLNITQLPTLDAGSRPDAPASEGTDSKSALEAPVDSPLTDTAPAREVSSEPTSHALAEVAGHTFQIAASDTLPDAGLYGRSCGTSNPGAVYRLTFSADGTKVEIERLDGVPEEILNGTLQPGSSSTISYDLTPTFAGGSLSIRRENGNLIGSLAIYGSGVPVIWCIESPMKSA